MNVKVNDNVLVITGKYKGKQGKVLKCDPKTGRVIVEGVNMVFKHEKARKTNETSRIVNEESYIDASNVMVVCPACNKPTRVYHAFVDGKKIRIHGGKDGCGKPLDTAQNQKKTAKKAAPVVEEEAPKKRTRKRSQKAAEASADENKD